MNNPPWQQSYLASIKTKLARRRLRAIKSAHAQGMKEGQEQYNPLLATMGQLLQKSQLFKIDSVIACAQQLVEQHLVRHPRAIIPMAQKVLKNIAEHTDAEIAAHPADAAVLASALGEITLGDPTRRSITIIEDEALKRGSLVVKANKSIIDAQLPTQLNQAREILLT